MSKTNRQVLFAVLLLVSFAAIGCEEPQPTSSSSTTSIAPPPAIEPSVAPQPITSPPLPPTVPPQLSAGETAPPASTDTTNRVVAEVGVGKRGRYDSNDYISTAVGAYFGIQQRLAFDQAQRGLNDYKTLHGDYPKTHEQYWKEVIEANLISLPELPAGEEYHYDYDSAQATRGEEALFVVKPKQ